MTAKRIVIALAVACAAVGAYLILTRQQMPEEEKIRRGIEDAAAAFERGRVGSFMRIIADDYEDAYKVTRPMLVDMVREATLGGIANNTVTIEAMDIRLAGDTMANVELTVTWVRKNPQGVPIGEATGRITAVMRKGDKGWQVVSSDGYESLASAYGV
ncbi:MAG TPA: hypothetical protein PLD23_20240 [Armatimonadota bacterium]|nr:hypothetical protein [Armatimonadota bacterium]HQK95840.1 hypothetical protein [Armatimonadota bacterium]